LTTGAGEAVTVVGALAALSVDPGAGGAVIVLDDLGSSATQYNVVTGGEPHSVDVRVIGSPPANVTVNDLPLPQLLGRVFHDADNNGIFDDADTGLANVAVYLFNEGGLLDPIASTTTDSDGFYTFTGLLPGAYRVVQIQPAGYLDGNETAGSLGGQVDNTQDSNAIAAISVALGDAGGLGYNFAEILPSRLHGLVWEDFNDDGEINFAEQALEDVLIELTGLDDRGNLVHRTALTDADGMYSFADLRPSGADGYVLREHQPAGRPDGKDTIGEVNGTPSGQVQSNDTVAGISIPRPGSIAANYNFGERAPIGAPVTHGQAAGIGFWQNKNGQALIKSLNGGETATQLGDWLAATLPNMYGATAVESNLAGKTNAEVAAFYKNLFKGPSKLETQVLATALAVYVTNSTLAGNVAASYGFAVTQYGVGVATFNVGARGSAFGLPDHSTTTVLDLLLAVNLRSFRGRLYDLDHDGDANDALETSLRTMAKEMFGAVNEAGGI
jgi:protocatechuate 3,4-dioxygenase beta subunit